MLTLKKSKVQEWHKKLGHMSYGKMIELLGKCTGMNLTKEEIKTETQHARFVRKQNNQELPLETQEVEQKDLGVGTLRRLRSH